MKKLQISRIALSIVLGVGAVMSFLLDWSPNHLLNPLWHPHARFHAAILLFLFAGAAATGLWLLWRESREPLTAIIAAGMISASYWTPFFFVPFLLPQSSWWAGTAGHEPRFGGVVVYPNLIVVGLFLFVTLAALGLAFSASRPPTQQTSRAASKLA